jgi:hypothetical protein
MRSTLLRYVAPLVALAVLALPVAAAETGMAGIHPWRKVGKKTCLVDHNHAGSGSGSTRAAAEKAAIQDWAGFTDLEYGDSWASFNVAIEKSMSCSKTPAGFSCDLVATPCRPW